MNKTKWAVLATTSKKMVEFTVRATTFEEACATAARELCNKFGGYQNINRVSRMGA